MDNTRSPHTPATNNRALEDVNADDITWSSRPPLPPDHPAMQMAGEECKRLLEDEFRELNRKDEIEDLLDASAQEGTPQWPDPLTGAALYGLAGDIVRAIEPHTEADPAAILIQALVAFGSVIGRNPHFTVENTRHGCNLNAVLVGNTSKGRKGTSWQQTANLLKSCDDDWYKACIAAGLSSGEGLIWAVRDPIEKKIPIKEKGRITGYQDELVDQGVEDKRLLIVESEFASVLKMSVREGNTLSAVIRQAWDDGNLRSLTKNSPARARDAHISLIGHITKDELRRYLEATEAANGFANRFLWLCVKRSKCLPEGGRLDTVDFGRILRRLRNAADFASNTGELSRNEEARDLWLDTYPDLSEGHPGMLGAVTSRAEAQVMRLACIYALLDCSPMIQRPHLEAALELWRYAEDSAKFIFGNAMGDPVADSILLALREAGKDGLSRTHISNLFSRGQSKATIDRALASLAEAGRAVSQKIKTDGRPSEMWYGLNALSKKAKKAKKGVDEPGNSFSETTKETKKTKKGLTESGNDTGTRRVEV